MRVVIPTIVTHPCTLFRDGLSQMLASTPFRPMHAAAELDGSAIVRLASVENCLWLMGLERCGESTLDLLRRMCATKPSLKPVILVQRQTTENVWRAIDAGARGFLYQNISCERLIKSLQLIALGEILVPADFLHAAASRLHGMIPPPSPEQPQETPQLTFVTGGLANGKTLPCDEETTALIKGLSNRERSILRFLMQGTSNKVIARELVITEATVKVHIKAILRKLRLRNRTQAAMWACSHLGQGGDHANGSGELIINSSSPLRGFASENATLTLTAVTS